MKKSHKGFTLIEIIISIIILSFVSAVLIRLFITADKLNDLANDKSIASVIASNAIESFDVDTPTYSTYYDEQWHVVSGDDIWSFVLKVTPTKDALSNLYHIETNVNDKNGKRILNYKTSRFMKGDHNDKAN